MPWGIGKERNGCNSTKIRWKQRLASGLLHVCYVWAGIEIFRIIIQIFSWYLSYLYYPSINLVKDSCIVNVDQKQSRSRLHTILSPWFGKRDKIMNKKDFLTENKFCSLKSLNVYRFKKNHTSNQPFFSIYYLHNFSFWSIWRIALKTVLSTVNDITLSFINRGVMRVMRYLS